MSVTMTQLATGQQFEAEERDVAMLRAQGCKPSAEVEVPTEQHDGQPTGEAVES